MDTLDNLKQIKKLDKGKVIESIEMLGEQINQVLQEFNKIKIPSSYKQIDKIVVNGMGGSALGPHIIRSIFFDQFKLPFGIVGGYELPASLNQKTLYIISSYSGDTEEPLSTIAAAQKKCAKIFVITSGGRLADLVKAGKLVGYVFAAPFNPSKQPRMGLGYSLGAQLALFKKLNLIKVSSQEIEKSLLVLDKLQTQFGIYNKT